MGDPIPDPQDIALRITGCEKWTSKQDGESFCSHHSPMLRHSWPCPVLTAATEQVRAALEQAWDDGKTWAVRRPRRQCWWPTNPYAKEG